MPTGKMTPMTMSDNATIGVYHVEPEGERCGGLVLVQEIFGITEHIRELCDEYAGDGYEALAPALYDREEPGFEAAYTGPDFDRAVKLAREIHPFDLSLADVQTCVDALKDRGPVFVVGYCYGGSVAWFAATRMTGVAAASGYYGSLIPGAADEEPKAPVILHFGRHDHGIPMEGVEKVIAKDWPNARVCVYEAGHGFNSDRRKDYHEPSADLAKANARAVPRQWRLMRPTRRDSCAKAGRTLDDSVSKPILQADREGIFRRELQPVDALIERELAVHEHRCTGCQPGGEAGREIELLAAAVGAIRMRPAVLGGGAEVELELRRYRLPTFVMQPGRDGYRVPRPVGSPVVERHLPLGLQNVGETGR